MLARPTDFSDPRYFTFLTIWHNQVTQDQQNQKAHDEYIGAASNWVVQNQQNQLLGLPISPLPTLPKMVTYNDDGSVMYAPFPDLTVPTLKPANPVFTSSGSGYSGPQQNMTMDQKLDAILMLLGQLVKS